MHYHYYKMSRDTAWEILRDTGLNTMPISSLKICRELGVRIKYFDFKTNEVGRATMMFGTPTILLNNDMTNEEKRFVCAHELGHLMLNHFGGDISHQDSDNYKKNGFENGAGQFATRLLLPACILWKCGVTTAEEAARLCGVKPEIAEKRIIRMRQLYKRDKFLTSPLEIEVYHNFLPFIEKYNEKKQMK